MSYAIYLEKAVWPSSLAVLYPHPASIGAGIPAWKVAGAVLLLAGISFLALRERQRRPYLAAGWLWYLGTSVPVIGLVQVGVASHADRYTYVPLIGVFLAAAWGVPDLLPKRRWRQWVLGVSAGAVLAALSVAACFQVGYWRDNVTLYSRVLAVTEKNWLVLLNLGAAYGDRGELAKADTCFREAVRIDPDHGNAWYNLGVADAKLGRIQEAIACFRETVRVKPEFAEGWYSLGLIYEKLGRRKEAEDSFREAGRLKGR